MFSHKRFMSLQTRFFVKVPDRGGRSWEQAPPPPEMPSWQQNRATGGAPTRGGGIGRGGPPRGSPGYRGEGKSDISEFAGRILN